MEALTRVMAAGTGVAGLRFVGLGENASPRRAAISSSPGVLVRIHTPRSKGIAPQGLPGVNVISHLGGSKAHLVFNFAEGTHGGAPPVGLNHVWIVSILGGDHRHWPCLPQAQSHWKDRP